MATDSLFVQSEVVRPKLQKWYESFNVASNLVKKGEVQKVGERDYRMPFETTPGGRFGTFNPDFGAIGAGSAFQGDVLKGSFFPLRLNFALSMLKMDATSSSEVAIVNALKDALKKGMPEMSVYSDFSFHGDGTATFGTATATSVVNSQQVYTLEPNMGIQRARRGMYVNVADSAYGSIKSSANTYIKRIDYANKKVILSGTVGSAANSDVLMYDGVSLPGSSAAPAWQRGLYYWNSAATSGYLAGIDRSVEPEVIANSVNVGGTITPANGLQLLDQIGQRRGEVADGLVGLANTSQRAAVYFQGVAISEWQRSSKDDMLDIMPNARKMEFSFCGVNHKIDYRQDRSRIDWIVPELWGRAQMRPLDYFELEGQGRFYRIYDPTSGTPLAGLQFSLVSNEDFYCVDPGGQGILTGLTLPSGY